MARLNNIDGMLICKQSGANHGKPNAINHIPITTFMHGNMW